MDCSEKCFHCDEKIIYKTSLEVDGSERAFCCEGCKTVFRILSSHGLDEYYNLRDSQINNRPDYKEASFLYLDDDEFRDKYLKIENGYVKFKFFLEGVHCVACLWLLEKLPVIYPGVVVSKLNMSSSVLSIKFKEGTSLGEIANQIQKLGYNPHPILTTEDQKNLAIMENRAFLIKIGVAFAAAGNIMLYSLANYFGATGIYQEYFNLFSFICFLPIIGFSSIPFYKTAFGSLRHGSLSIDVPIVFAIFTGFLLGIYSFIFKADYFYFDTLSVLVLLLLASRYLLKTTQQKSLETNDLMSFFSGKFAVKQMTENGKIFESQVLTKFLRVKDIVIVKSGETVPIDGKIISGHGHINNSLITGEVTPEKIHPGQFVFMGAINLSSEIIIEVVSVYGECRLSKTLQEVEAGWSGNTKLSYISDRIAKRFVLIVFIIASFFMVYFSIIMDFETALNRTLALIIITCPCALALSTPLALALGLSSLAKSGVIIKNENIIERIVGIKKIFFDKTGTLTKGEFEVINFKLQEANDRDLGILGGMEFPSKHPIAQSITKYLVNNNIKIVDIKNWSETPGVGVQGEFEGSAYKVEAISLSNSSNTELNEIGLYQGEKLILHMSLRDRVRPGVKKILEKFYRNKIDLAIVSGDKKKIVQRVARELSFRDDNVYYEYTPEDKKELVLKHDDSMMVGDGVNDAIALMASSVGIAVKGSVEVSLRAADVYLSKSGVEHIWEVVESSRFIMKVIYRNLIFSFFYNIIGIYLAFSGQVTPVVAAILMPLSSVTVVISTIVATKKIQNKLITSVN